MSDRLDKLESWDAMLRELGRVTFGAMHRGLRAGRRGASPRYELTRHALARTPPRTSWSSPPFAPPVGRMAEPVQLLTSCEQRVHILWEVSCCDADPGDGSWVCTYRLTLQPAAVGALESPGEPNAAGFGWRLETAESLCRGAGPFILALWSQDDET